jgi:hypothetical protein
MAAQDRVHDAPELERSQGRSLKLNVFALDSVATRAASPLPRSLHPATPGKGTKGNNTNDRSSGDERRS